jgi:hypothetical protein
MKTIERMKTELSFYKSGNNFRVTSSDMGGSSIQSNSDNYNRSGASFYTMPEKENEVLLKENDDLKSEISELEMSLQSDEYSMYNKSTADI